MDTRPCSFCSHENPEDAKFCNACGSSMHLQLCRQCGAIDNMSAIACYKCGTSFAGAVSADAKPADPAAEPAPGGLPAGHEQAPPEPAMTGDGPAPKIPSRTAAARGQRVAKALALGAGVGAALYWLYGPALTGDEARPALVHDPARAAPDFVDAMLGVVPPAPADRTDATSSALPSAALQSSALPPDDAPPDEAASTELPRTAPPATEPAAAAAEQSAEIEGAPEPVPEPAATDAGDVLVAAPAPELPAAPPLGDAPPPPEPIPAAPEPSDAARPPPPLEAPPGCSPAIDALGLCD